MAKHAAPVSVFTWAFLAMGFLLFGLAGVAWANHVSSEGERVANNVSFAGEAMEGSTPEDVTAEVASRAEDVLGHEVLVEFGEDRLPLRLGSVGFSYDQPATVAEIVEARHRGSVWRQFSSWAVSGLSELDVEEHWSFDAEEARSVLEAHPGLVPIEVEEPKIEFDGSGNVVMVPGVLGTEANVDQLLERLASIDLVAPPETIRIDADVVQPTVSDEEAAETVQRLVAATGDGVDIAVNGRQVTLTAPALQRNLMVEIGSGEIVTRFDPAGLQGTLEETLVGPVGDFEEPTFQVEDDQITVVTPGEPPPVCCREGSGQWLGEQILSGAAGPFALQPRPTDDPNLLAWSDGSLVVEKVAEFTTPHACCETRVRNIHRIADIVRGAYLVPGERLSLNEYVGPRTVENGFFAAGAIRQGHLIQEVGGGVSQFATTIFNAAYFAGMDFEEYRSHTIYFSRYPFGREATISNPAPDLVMVNTTDYPILIWTSYTDTSITVSMYSTKHIEVTEIDQRRSSRGECTHVETDRQRSYPDGRVVVDTFVADYRPAEGVDCNGNRIPPPA